MSGSAIPDKTYWLLSVLAEDTVTGAPAATRAAGRDALDPTVTFPKFSELGETESVPGLVPVPESGISSRELDALETISRVPLAAPAADGVKVALKVTLWDGFSVSGRLSPEMEKAAPETFAWEMVSADPAVFVKDSHKFPAFPTCTLPKARLVGFAVSVPEAGTAMVTVYFAVDACPPLPCTEMLNA